MTTEITTTTLRNGAKVLAHDTGKYAGDAKKYMNRAAAERAAYDCGGHARQFHSSPVFFVVLG